ncbi:MAG: cation:proton antiporter [Thermomicrobiales bacterium]|nr:cation:proton antiporter [Thermomicrobiales bacterium]
MENSHLIADLVAVIAIALLGGLIARRLKQPAVLGYIVAGVLLGPNTPGLTVDPEQVDLLANVGVAFLMFAIGVEFSISEILRVRRIALIGGALQIPLTMLLGASIGLAVGWSWQSSVVLGAAFALSSSVFALTFLVRRGEMETPQGKITLALMVVQDLAMIPLIALLPVLEGENDHLIESLIRSFGVAAIALAVVVVLGAKLVPRLLFVVARTESRELFLLMVVLIALGTAIASERAGLSIALGAFLAGLVVSESEFDRHVLGEIGPLRDLFSTLFFVAIGMLLVPEEIAKDWHVFVVLLLALLAGKALITGGSLLAGGADHRAAALCATIVAQMGEFSFVLAGESHSDHIITSHQYSLILAVAVASIVATPFMARFGQPLSEIAESLPGVEARESEVWIENSPPVKMAQHAIICGYGRVGAVLGDALQRRGFRYAVIDLNPAIVRRLREQNVPAYYGDASSADILIHAGVAQAKVLVVATADLVSAPAAIRHAKRLNPQIAVISRAPGSGNIDVLRAAGADEIIQPEFEAGMESIRYVLREFGVSMRETTAIISKRRAIHYQDGPDAGFEDPEGTFNDELTFR